MFDKPANKQSKSMRKPVYGAGINDLDYIILERLPNGKYKHCPYYLRWKNMLERCFSDHYKAKWPTYTNVTCCDDWLIASNFIDWMKQQDWKDKHLDKDILRKNNKTYAPDFCLFIPQELNKLLNFNQRQRGKYGIGISEYRDGKYKAAIRDNGRNLHLGWYDSIEEVQNVYLEAKKNLIAQAAHDHKHLHPNLESRLISIANDLKLSDF